jgi:ribosomal protein S18 acetylase RimI-like enzyme
MLGASEVGEAVAVLSRGMRDNPGHVAAFGEHPERRLHRLRTFFDGAFAVMNWQTLVARSGDGTIVGVMAMSSPGTCRPSITQQLRILPRQLQNGPRSVLRMARWLAVWDQHDPDERHWHFGPLAVDAHLQGMGIGSKLMGVFCARMDAAGEDAYLETDKQINVTFYERFGFEVVGEEEVLSVSNWFMLRRVKKGGEWRQADPQMYGDTWPSQRWPVSGAVPLGFVSSLVYCQIALTRPQHDLRRCLLLFLSDVR